MTPFLYLAVFALFLLLTGFRLFADGMFVDGVTYATIARNMAEGIGTFWDPYYTATLDPHFYGHPPLGIGLESLAFRIAGDHLLTERIFSLGTYLVTGYLVVLIWKEITGSSKSGWIPLLLWVLIPNVSWAAASNLLDNILCVFTTLSVLMVFRNFNRRNPVYLVLAGLSVFAGLLVKGPFALFPWGLPFLLQLRSPSFSLKKAFINTLLIVSCTVVPLIFLLTISEPARYNLNEYWHIQILANLQGIKTVTSRFYILGVLAVQLAVPLLTGTILIALFRKYLNKNILTKYKKDAILLLLLGISGVIPVMISMKQRSFYIMPALPYFALMIALFVAPVLESPLSALQSRIRFMYAGRVAIILIFAASLIIPPLYARHNGRDRQELAMVREFGSFVPEGATIRIHPSLFNDWSLHAYFARILKISLDPGNNPGAEYYLAPVSFIESDTVVLHWKPVGRLNGFGLFRK